MEKYLHFDVEDLVVDELFIRWVLNPTTQDIQLWETWLKANPGQLKKVDQAKNIITSIRYNAVQQAGEEDIAQFIEQVRRQHNHHSNTRRPIVWFRQAEAGKWMAIAALLIIVFALALYFIPVRPEHSKTAVIKKKPVGNILIVSHKTSRFIHLPDGSSVVLKPGSSLVYPVAFNTSKREVTLAGEAFFEVKRNLKQPFLIQSGEMTTRVVGTSFTVRAYKAESSFKVTVNTGKVRVQARSKEKAVNDVLLLANQQLTFYRKKIALVKEKPAERRSAVQQTIAEQFEFNETPIPEVIGRLEKAYQVDIVYDEQRMENCTLTASLYNDPLYEKLAVICKAIGASLTVSGGNIEISGDGCSP